MSELSITGWPSMRCTLYAIVVPAAPTPYADRCPSCGWLFPEAVLAASSSAYLLILTGKGDPPRVAIVDISHVVLPRDITSEALQDWASGERSDGVVHDCIGVRGSLVQHWYE